MKRKSFSKKGSCLSFLTGGISREETNFQLMRISLKKEMDRKQKLETLLQKYTEIRAQEKTHIKLIKSSIIELKDTEPISKIKFLVDPNIYVDNNLSIETRQFLCLLLNTFYKRYDQNSQFQKEVSIINDQIKTMIKSISYNEQMLFKVQKQNINHQVQMEGELLSEKNRLKDEKEKTKELETEKNRVSNINSQQKKTLEEHHQRVRQLEKDVEAIQTTILGMNEKILRGEKIRQGNLQKMSDQLVYQMKFDDEIQLIKSKVDIQEKRHQQLIKKISAQKKKVDRLKGIPICEVSSFQTQMKALDLNYPKMSAAAVQSKDINILGQKVKIMKIIETPTTNDGLFF